MLGLGGRFARWASHWRSNLAGLNKVWILFVVLAPASLAISYFYVGRAYFLLQVLFWATCFVLLSLKWNDILWQRAEKPSPGKYKFYPTTLVQLIWFVVPIAVLKPSVLLIALNLVASAIAYIPCIGLIEEHWASVPATPSNVRRLAVIWLLVSGGWLVTGLGSVLLYLYRLNAAYKGTLLVSSVFLGIAGSIANAGTRMQHEMFARKT